MYDVHYSVGCINIIPLKCTVWTPVYSFDPYTKTSHLNAFSLQLDMYNSSEIIFTLITILILSNHSIKRLLNKRVSRPAKRNDYYLFYFTSTRLSVEDR